jgi:hypothetical protein
MGASVGNDTHVEEENDVFVQEDSDTEDFGAEVIHASKQSSQKHVEQEEPRQHKIQSEFECFFNLI